MAYSKIEWTESSWNPVTGCTKISDGCKNCYAERMAKRLQNMGQESYKNGFRVTLHPEKITLPLFWKTSRLIFVNSMSDLFHEDVPDSFIKEMIDVMKNAHWHTFQVLTKRAERLYKFSQKNEWPENVWVGVTVEKADYLDRLDYLRDIDAQVKFVSMEPLLGPIKEINLSGIDWVIVGGESGPHSRPMKKIWVEDIMKICQEENVPFFFKQWGGFNKKKTGRLLDGKIFDEMPQKVLK